MNREKKGWGCVVHHLLLLISKWNWERRNIVVLWGHVISVTSLDLTQWNVGRDLFFNGNWLFYTSLEAQKWSSIALLHVLSTSQNGWPFNTSLDTHKCTKDTSPLTNRLTLETTWAIFWKPITKNPLQKKTTRESILVPNLDSYMFPTQLVQKSLGTNDLINPWRTSLLLMQQRFVTRYDSLSWKKSQSAWWWRCKIRLFKIPKWKNHTKGGRNLHIVDFRTKFSDHILKVGELKSTCKTRRGHETWRQPTPNNVPN